MGGKWRVRDKHYSCPYCKKMGGFLLEAKPDHETWRCSKCLRDTRRVKLPPVPLGGKIVCAGDGRACLRYGRISHASERSVAKQKQDANTFSHWERVLKPQGYRDGGFWFDEDVSAAVVPFLDRKYARDLYENARPGDIILAQFGTRTFRSMLDMGITLERLTQRGISLQVMDLPIDLSTTIGKALGGILIIFGEVEVGWMSERQINDKESRMKQGKPHAANAPMGWKVATVAGEKAYVPDEEQRELCQKCLEQSLAGRNGRDIAEEVGKCYPTVLKMIKAAREDFPHPRDVYLSPEAVALREKKRLKKRLRRGQAFLNGGSGNPML